MPRSCRSQRSPRVAELGERRRAKVVSHVCYIPQMAELATSQQMFADISSLIARLREPPSPAGAVWGRMRGDEEDVCRDAAKTARSAPQRCQVGGSTVCRALRAASRLAQDAYR